MSQHCHTLVFASIIVTQNATRDVLHDAAVAVHDARVVAVGPRTQMTRQWQADTTLDLGQAMLIPGLVNAHTHAAMTFLRGLADDMPLMEWLNTRIFPIEQQLTKDIVYYASLLGYAEMLRTGTTSCLDMYLFMDAALQAAEMSGIRCTAGEVIFSFPTLVSPSWEHALAWTRDTAQRLRQNPRCRLMICPHSVYTTTPQIIRACNDAALECSLPLQIHLAESASEVEQSLATHHKSPVALCHELGLFHEGTSLAHVVATSDADIALLRDTGAVPVHNPSSNMKLASGIARIAYMQSHAIPLALGTDGAASNNRLNMFTEMGRCALLHKVDQRDCTTMAAQTVLDMATHGGAQAMQQPLVGQIAPDFFADMTALALDSPNMQPMYAPVSHLVYAATGMEVCWTMVHGEVVYHNGVFTRFNYAELLQEMQTIARWVRQKI